MQMEIRTCDLDLIGDLGMIVALEPTRDPKTKSAYKANEELA
jgi:hypothetical protein